ncbi:MAG: nitrile hydratase subunit beta [Rhizobiaceae bacterium]|nr:nitrile hydratase subunit beta [Rhizobiaceae bacterium]
MNGPHDMGGMQFYGPVKPEANEPVFHADWEKRALAMTVGMGFTGQWNLDVSRFARESLAPDFYLTKSYYQIWVNGLQNLMLERGLVTENEIATGKMETHPVEVKRVVSGEEMPAALAAGGPVARDPEGPAAFSVGDRVTTTNIHPTGHTRLPRYARGKTGEIIAIHGCHVFPDSNARGDGENPQWLYAVKFDAQALFGSDAEAGNTVVVDCWEPYLERS